MSTPTDAAPARLAASPTGRSRLAEGLHTPERFASLQARAARAGHQLLQVTGGYMLLFGSASHHAADLDAIAVLLARGGPR